MVVEITTWYETESRSAVAPKPSSSLLFMMKKIMHRFCMREMIDQYRRRRVWWQNSCQSS